MKSLPLKAEVQAHVRVSPTVYRVGVSLSRVAPKDDVVAAIETATDGCATVIPGTLRVSPNGQIAQAFVRANRPSKPYTAEAYDEVTASIAQDTSGRLWNIVEVDGEKRVVAMSQDDLDDLLAKRTKLRSRVVPASEGSRLAAVAKENGDFVAYVDADTAEVATGFVVATRSGTAVIGRDLSVREVKPLQFVSVASRSRLSRPIRDVFKEQAALDDGQISTIISYLRKAYADSPLGEEMLAQYEDMVRSAA